MHYRHSHKEWIDLDNDNPIKPDLSLLSDGWFKSVTGLKQEKKLIVKKINRHYYEIAVCTVLMGDLSCGDAYVDDAFIYDDPNKQLITWEEFEIKVDPYCDLVKLSKERGKFIVTLQNRLQQTAKNVDENYHNNPYLVIDKGLPVLKKLPKKKEYPDLDKIRQRIMDEMPIKSIVGYYHVSDQYIALFSNFISCGAHESIYLLDSI